MRIFFVLLIPVLLTSCSSKLVEPLDKNPLSITPAARPMQNMTNFTKSVSCLDNLISDRVKDKVIITIDALPNESNDKMADSAKTMLHTALSNMGARNQKIRVIDFKSAKTGTLNTLHENKKKEEKTTKRAFEYPEYFIQGSISQSEKKFAKKGGGVGVKAGDIANLDVSSEENASALALDLQAGYIDNLQLIPGVFSNNILSIVENEEEVGGGVAFMKKASIDFSMDYERKDGVSAAIRSLIELGAVELVGKLLHLPYEECLTDEGRMRVLSGKLNVPAAKNDTPALTNTSQPIDVKLGVDIQFKDKEFVLDVELSDSGYAICYYKDEENAVSMVYPNSSQQMLYLVPNQKLSIPSAFSNFKLQATGIGQHEFMCVSSKTDILSNLPAYLKVESLKPIAGANLEKILSDIKALGVVSGSAKQQITINK